MTSTSELENIKSLLNHLIQQVDALTTQTVDLMSLKNVGQAYRDEEIKVRESLVREMSLLRQLAEMTLGNADHSDDKLGEDTT